MKTQVKLTPRTDKEIFYFSDGNSSEPSVSPSFARQLELENNNLLADNARLKEALKRAKAKSKPSPQTPSGSQPRRGN
jgi:hypothetical protein